MTPSDRHNCRINLSHVVKAKNILPKIEQQSKDGSEKKYKCLPKATFWITHYLDCHIQAVDEQKGHNPTIKKQAAKISKAAASLRSAMAAANDETIELIGLAHGKLAYPELGGSAVRETDQFIKYWYDYGTLLSAMEGAAAVLGRKLPSQNRSDSMYDLICKLAKIWKNASGNTPTTNRSRQELTKSSGFDAFWEEALKALPLDEAYHYGAEAAVQDVIKHWND